MLRYRKACSLALDKLNELSTDLRDKSPAEKQELFKRCAETTLNSKLISGQLACSRDPPIQNPRGGESFGGVGSKGSAAGGTRQHRARVATDGDSRAGLLNAAAAEIRVRDRAVFV